MPRARLSVVPEARLSVVPEARLSVVPEARLRVVPGARLSLVPEARLIVVPGARLSNVAGHAAQIDLPYTPQQVFDLVADIESYPRFLPHVASAHIRSRVGNVLVVDQRFRFKVIDLPFTTRAVLEPPARIEIVCADAPFGTFTEQWSFAANPSGGTTLRSSTEFSLRSFLLRPVLSAAFGELQAATLRAFKARARELYA